MDPAIPQEVPRSLLEGHAVPRTSLLVETKVSHPLELESEQNALWSPSDQPKVRLPQTTRKDIYLPGPEQGRTTLRTIEDGLGADPLESDMLRVQEHAAPIVSDRSTHLDSDSHNERPEKSPGTHAEISSPPGRAHGMRAGAQVNEVPPIVQTSCCVPAEIFSSNQSNCLRSGSVPANCPLEKHSPYILNNEWDTQAEPALKKHPISGPLNRRAPVSKIGSRLATPSSAQHSCSGVLSNADPAPVSSSSLEKRLSIDAEMGQDGCKTVSNDLAAPAIENFSSLNNLMTSITSFLPSFRPLKGVAAVKDGVISDSITPAQSEPDRAAAAAALKLKDELRMQRQKVNAEKQKRAETKRVLLEMAEKQRKEEQRCKQAERTRKLQDAANSKKRKQIEEDKKRERKRQRVEENRKRIVENANLEAHQDRTVSQGLVSSQASKDISQIAGPSTRSMHVNMKMKEKVRILKSTKEVSPPVSYEMTAKKSTAGHNSDSDDDRPRPSKKVLPTWARSSALSNVLVKETRDPDTIFERVHTINLEDVFDGLKSKKFRPRTSSGVWIRDRLTSQEEVEYKKQTGLL
jgi:Inner centromere protein, ARK binding region